VWGVGLTPHNLLEIADFLLELSAFSVGTMAVHRLFVFTLLAKTVDDEFFLTDFARI
jgi:hypothetical protein